MSQTVAVVLYKNYSDPFVVHKRLTSIATVYCQITEETPLDSLELLLDMRSDIDEINYCRIEEFGRYYFCTPKVVNGNQIRLSCESDPLTSFWNSFSGSSCIAERSTSNPNPELIDDLLPFKPQPKFSYRTMGTGFTPSSSSGRYILTIGGK